MKETTVVYESYVGRIVEDDTEHPAIYYLEAEEKGINKKGYTIRKWFLADDVDDAYDFPTSKYTVGQVEAILKVTELVRYYTKQHGYRLEVLRYRSIRELMQVDKNAHPLVQLGMLAD